jgi:hypothetical protein
MRRPRNLGVMIPLASGLVASASTLASAIDDPRRALVGWIAAFGFATATVVAALILVMVLHVTGARWWLVLRGVFIATAGTAPLLVPLFVPIGAAFSIVYPWASTPSEISGVTAEALEHQRAWNHGSFFLARAAVYLVAWTTLAILVRRASAARLERPSADNLRRERKLGAIGLPILGFTLTFASFDWIMALQAGWTSNMFGLYVFTSGLVAALSVIAIGSWLAARSGVVDMHPDHVHALGRLMLMAIILWTYIGFFQLLLVWIADLPHEVGFYIARSRGGWIVVDILLVGGRFVLPMLALFSRALKRSSRMLAAVAAWLLVTSILDFAWLTLPAFATGLSPRDVLPFVAVVAFFSAYGAHVFHLCAAGDTQAPDPIRENALRYRSP